MLVWIVGHSFVKWAGRHASTAHYGKDLGMARAGVTVTWQGKSGMLWGELRSVLNAMKKRAPCPDVLVIHLGENDMVKEKSLAIVTAMKEDLRDIGRCWSGTYIMWCVWMPRRVWRGARKPAAIDRARKKVNREMGKFCKDRMMGQIENPEITYEDKGFFRQDGVHFSRLGLECYIFRIREAVAEALGVETWPRGV